MPDFTNISEIQENPSEAELLNNVSKVIDGLIVYTKDDQQRMLECLETIVGGQILDLERFGPAKEGGKYLLYKIIKKWMIILTELQAVLEFFGQKCH